MEASRAANYTSTRTRPSFVATPAYEPTQYGPGHASRPSMDINETLDLDLQLKMPRSSSQSTLAEVEEGRLEAAT